MKRTPLRQLDESHLIRRLTARWKKDASVVAGVGDDCAVLRRHVGKSSSSEEEVYQLFKTDAVVEGRHFRATTPARWIGRKALARTLSDVAAMGGVPRHALVTLGLPPEISLKKVEGIYTGLTDLADEYAVKLVGGETTRTPVLLLAISLLGETRGYPPVLRSGARVGHEIFVTGTLGKSQGRKHLHFTPRLKEGRFLAEGLWASAMMDVSDGLGTDLPRLAQASRVGFQIDLDRLPRTPGATYQQACADGEDYELLFTVPAKKVAAFLTAWPFSTRLTGLGKIIPPTQPHTMLPHGYDHLQNA